MYIIEFQKQLQLHLIAQLVEQKTVVTKVTSSSLWSGMKTLKSDCLGSNPDNTTYCSMPGFSEL